MFEGSLRCPACGHEGPARPLATTCPTCDGPLLARHVPPSVGAPDLLERWRGREGGMWRFRELLPIGEREAEVTLGEGGTPLLPLRRIGAEADGLEVLVKDESRNPTGSFKDRGLSAAVTRAVADGAEGLVIPSAGNAGAALSAYAARAGVPARVYLPADTPSGVRRRCEHYGAEIVEVEGLIDDCGRKARADASDSGRFDVSTFREPYRVEGKKTMMLEIVETLGEPPDAIVYPTGGGTGLVATWKVLDELRELGRGPAATRLYAVQSDGCAPLVRAWEEERDEAEPWEEPETRAYGLRVPHTRADSLILRALRETGGAALAVPDEEMADGAARLGREGIGASIEGGATVAALRRLARESTLAEGETVVLFNTGGLFTY